ncbi:MAG: hypothetical protein ACRD4Y_12275 [Candidatus Acidiferrales bacterium]
MYSLPGEGRHEQFDALLSGILREVDELSEALAQLYFSHAVVSRELGGMREEREP